jgi:MFS family permease
VDFLFGATFLMLLRQKGLNGSEVGLVLALGTFAAALLMLPSGASGDRFGHRRMVILGLSLWGGGQIIYGLTAHIVVMAVSTCMWAVGMAMYGGSSISLMTNVLHRKGAGQEVPNAIRGEQIIRWTASAVGAVSSILLLHVIPVSVLFEFRGLG